MSCKFCGKTFNRRFNLKRHESDYCPLRHENSDTDDESQDMKSDDDDISTASNIVSILKVLKLMKVNQDLEVKWKMKVILGNR